MYDKIVQAPENFLVDRHLGLTQIVLTSCGQLTQMIQSGNGIIIDGESLDIASVLAVAR